jgi:RNA polymerase sigma-B factor
MAQARPARRRSGPVEHAAALHEEYFRTRDPRVREQLMEAHAGLARALARRFKRRPHTLDDLTQVAFLGLLKAIDGFDPTRGLQFSTYGAQTILGDLKRHLRDHSWGIRPSRRVHDLYLAVERALDDLSQALGRPPTVGEVASRIDACDEDVLEAMEAATGRRLQSLDSPIGEGVSLSDAIGANDRALVGVERRLTVDALLGRLPSRDQEVLRMRFERQMSQVEIARVLGGSQMQISRALTRSLGRLRAMADTDSGMRAVLAE